MTRRLLHAHAAAAIALALALLAPAARACTTFCFENDSTTVFGKNYDWNVDDGLVIVNKRGVAKRAMTANGPMEWTSRFGSVTFNQYGREFPSGGINEKGLVVELMWLDDTTYPEPDARGALPTLQWIQYQLDVSATVEDVVASDAVVRIAPSGSAKIHFLVADAAGHTAAIEFIDGRLVAHRGESMPYRVLTNDTYARSAEYARGGNAGETVSSLDRFARAAARLESRKTTSHGRAIEEAFDLLEDVAQGEYTQWSIVYDLDERRVYFRTRAHRTSRFVDLDSLAFECDTPVRVIDMNAAHTGDLANHLTDYTYDANYTLVRTAFTKTDFLRAVPLKAREELARYPESTRCTP